MDLQPLEQVGHGVVGLKASEMQTLSQPLLLLLVCSSSGKLICFDSPPSGQDELFFQIILVAAADTSSRVF